MGGWLRRDGGEVGEGTAEGGTCFRCEVQEKSYIRGIKSIRGGQEGNYMVLDEACFGRGSFSFFGGR